TTSISCPNFVRDGIYNGFKSGLRDIKLDLTAEANTATSVPNLVDGLNLLMMSGQMTPEMRQKVIDNVSTVSLSDKVGRARAAIPRTFADYKALVCLFLFGGNDPNNLVIPTSTDEYNAYSTARQ